MADPSRGSSSVGSPSNSEDEKTKQDFFGPFLSIDPSSLISLASRIRKDCEGAHADTNGKVVTFNGSYNLVHSIEFTDGVKYVIRIPATAWGDRFTETAKQALVSQALTMRFIAEKTQVPVPRVYAFDTSNENEIGWPHIVMSFIPGCPAYELWRYEKEPTSEKEKEEKEKKRAQILKTVAEAICQLEQLQFDKIGSLQFQPDGQINIGPCYEYYQGKLGDNDYGKYLRLDAHGPFDSTSTYLIDSLRRTRNPGDTEIAGWARALHTGCEQITATAISYLPTVQVAGRENFALSVPDFNYQNIMVDENGNLTGMIDWDCVQTQPRCYGPCSYPSWITRDWDPVMYGYPHSVCEDSPEELRGYRWQYYCHIKESNICENNVIARKSHLFEAVVIAAGSEMCRSHIIEKFVGCAMQLADRNGQSDFIIGLVDEELTDEEVNNFENKLKDILSVESKYSDLSDEWK